MASAKQIAWRKKFKKKYAVKGKKKKGSKSTKSKKSKLKLKKSEYGTSKDPHQIPQDMLDELYQSKVRGFPFFVYTGIREFVMMGNDSLLLKEIPPNPNKISAIQINYNKGADGFTIDYFVGNSRVANPQILYVGDLAPAIVDKMGIS